MSYQNSHTRQAIDILNHLNVLAPLDLLVRTPADVAKRLRWGDCFLREVVEKGKVLYEAADA